MPYIGQKGEQILCGLKKKLSRCLNITNVQIGTRVTTTKLNIFTNLKDKVSKQNKSNIVYEFTCQKCNNGYIGTTDRTLLERTKEHAYIDKERNKHLHSCYGSENMTVKTNKEQIELVLNSTKVIDSSNNRNLLLYKDVLLRKSQLNNGLKARRELQLLS